MKIPEQIKVGGHTYKVVRNYKFKERVDIHGQCDHCFQEIRLGEEDGGGKFSKSKIEEVFMHELFHCVDEVYNSGNLSKEDETITRLAQGLYQVLKDSNLLRE